MGGVHSSLRRLAGSWTVEFSTRHATTLIFEEGSGPLFTDGTFSCMQPNHVEYSIKLEDGAVGTRLTMDDRVNPEKTPELAETLRVGGLPTIIAFRGGRESTRVEGAVMAGDLVRMVS